MQQTIYPLWRKPYSVSCCAQNAMPWRSQRGVLSPRPIEQARLYPLRLGDFASGAVFFFVTSYKTIDIKYERCQCLWMSVFHIAEHVLVVWLLFSMFVLAFQLRKCRWKLNAVWFVAKHLSLTIERGLVVIFVEKKIGAITGKRDTKKTQLHLMKNQKDGGKKIQIGLENTIKKIKSN